MSASEGLAGFGSSWPSTCAARRRLGRRRRRSKRRQPQRKPLLLLPRAWRPTPLLCSRGDRRRRSSGSISIRAGEGRQGEGQARLLEEVARGRLPQGAHARETHHPWPRLSTRPCAGARKRPRRGRRGHDEGIVAPVVAAFDTRMVDLLADLGHALAGACHQLLDGRDLQFRSRPRGGSFSSRACGEAVGVLDELLVHHPPFLPSFPLSLPPCPLIQLCHPLSPSMLPFLPATTLSSLPFLLPSFPDDSLRHWSSPPPCLVFLPPLPSLDTP